MAILNQNLGIDEVRRLTTVAKFGIGRDGQRREIGYDVAKTFTSTPVHTLLPPGTRLFRLMMLANGYWFEGLWWMPKEQFTQLQHAAARAGKDGEGLRESLAEALALPSATQVSVVEIELTQPVYGWVGIAAPIPQGPYVAKARPGGATQIFLPNLAERGNTRFSNYARVIHTYSFYFGR